MKRRRLRRLALWILISRARHSVSRWEHILLAEGGQISQPNRRLYSLEQADECLP